MLNFTRRARSESATKLAIRAPGFVSRELEVVPSRNRTHPIASSPGRGTSWSEVSNINFGDYQLKQNRFAKRVKKEGILLVHDSPSRASLKAIPEADFGRVKVRRSNYAERIKGGGLTLQVGRGRPRGGAETGPTVLKSVRLPPAIWKELEKRARAEGVAVHALVRKAILALLRSAA